MVHMHTYRCTTFCGVLHVLFVIFVVDFAVMIHKTSYTTCSTHRSNNYYFKGCGPSIMDSLPPLLSDANTNDCYHYPACGAFNFNSFLICVVYPNFLAARLSDKESGPAVCNTMYRSHHSFIDCAASRL